MMWTRPSEQPRRLRPQDAWSKLGPSAFRLRHLDAYAAAAREWLHDAAEVVDTTHLTPAQAAGRIVTSVVE